MRSYHVQWEVLLMSAVHMSWCCCALEWRRPPLIHSPERFNWFSSIPEINNKRRVEAALVFPRLMFAYTVHLYCVCTWCARPCLTVALSPQLPELPPRGPSHHSPAGTLWLADGIATPGSQPDRGASLPHRHGCGLLPPRAQVPCTPTRRSY